MLYAYSNTFCILYVSLCIDVVVSTIFYSSLLIMFFNSDVNQVQRTMSISNEKIISAADANRVCKLYM